MLGSPGYLHDPALTGWLRRTALRIWPRGPALRVHVLDASAPQADLLGPTLVRVNLGLLRELHSGAEAAFVLAHETAHRELGHLDARLEPGWDGEAAELAADAWARQRLIDLGYGAATGSVLLGRLARDPRWHEARPVLQRRAEALAALDAGGLQPAPDPADGFTELMARHRAPSR